MHNYANNKKVKTAKESIPSLTFQSQLHNPPVKNRIRLLVKCSIYFSWFFKTNRCGFTCYSAKIKSIWTMTFKNYTQNRGSLYKALKQKITSRWNCYKPTTSDVYTAVQDLTKTCHFPMKIVPCKGIRNFSNINNSSLFLQHRTHYVTKVRAVMTAINQQQVQFWFLPHNDLT